MNKCKILGLVVFGLCMLWLGKLLFSSHTIINKDGERIEALQKRLEEVKLQTKRTEAISDSISVANNKDYQKLEKIKLGAKERIKNRKYEAIENITKLPTDEQLLFFSKWVRE